MARIRTIKPEFFRSLKLYRAEVEEKLPLRVAYSGLWTSCCREGRFKWVPEMLKLDCLPYDNVDFSRVLDALWTRGYVEKYESEGEFYGFIPSWNEHQSINNRESASNLPDPESCNILTCESRVPDASQGERKGKERKINIYDKEYFKDSVMNEKFIAHLKIRDKIKAVNSDQAISTLVNKLRTLSNNNRTLAIEILDNAIANSWKSYYPPK